MSQSRSPRLFATILPPGVGLLVGLGLAACGGTPPGPPHVSPDASEAPDAVPVDARTCRPPEGTSGKPSTIDEAVSLINGLLTQHGEVTIPCFIESLDRPLQLNATRSIISAQPAVGARSPRLFLFTPNMSMSVVAEGVGRPFLELGQLTAPARSVKAEIEFPVHEPLTREAPYQRLPFGSVTTCGLCHADERPVFGIPNAVESEALRPEPDKDVPLTEVWLQYETCNAQIEPDRCQILDAIFGHGPVQAHAFPEEIPTIFDR